MNKAKLRLLFNRHFEWVTFSVGLVTMAMMNPYIDTGSTWCLFEQLGLPCPGHGLGHSIAFIFRGDWHNAMQANFMGPFAIIIILGRIIVLIKQNLLNYNTINE